MKVRVAEAGADVKMYQRAGTMYLDVPRISRKGLNYSLLGATPSWRVHRSRHAFQSLSGRKLTRVGLRHTTKPQSAFIKLHPGHFLTAVNRVINVCIKRYCYMSLRNGLSSSSVDNVRHWSAVGRLLEAIIICSICFRFPSSTSQFALQADLEAVSSS